MNRGAGLRPCRWPSGRRERRRLVFIWGRLVVESAERKLGGRAEARPKPCPTITIARNEWHWIAIGL
jgi:hypothetical protein